MLDVLFRTVVSRCDAEARQILGHRADVRRDGHAVVVQNHDDVLAQCPRIVQSLERLAARQCAVADDGGDAVMLARDVTRRRHAEGGRDRRARMTCAESVVDGLLALGESRDAAFLAKTGECLAPACQNLVRIRLMTDVPDDLVLRTVERPVQGERKLHRAKARGEMTARLGNCVDNIAAQFSRQLRKLIERAAFQRVRFVYAFQQLSHIHPPHFFRPSRNSAKSRRKAARSPKMSSAATASSTASSANFFASSREVSVT